MGNYIVPVPTVISVNQPLTSFAKFQDNGIYTSSTPQLCSLWYYYQSSTSYLLTFGNRTPPNGIALQMCYTSSSILISGWTQMQLQVIPQTYSCSITP